MEEPAVEAAAAAADGRLPPLRGEPVGDERLVFGPDPLALGGVDGEPQAPLGPVGVACEGFQAPERGFRQRPQLPRAATAPRTACASS